MSVVEHPSIPGYTIKSVLGSGAFATVYLATQHTLQRDVALKIMNPMLTSDEGICTRFLREARDTASVSNHPNIVTIHDVGEIEYTYYIAMQYLSGSTLRQCIDTEGPIPDPCRVLCQMADALSYIHQRHFIHRDIKPANILFNDSGEAVLSDFGVARTNNSTQLTRQGSIVGTARYMSPEQSRGDPSLDARSDLYSLGVVFHEMLTGQPAYQAADPIALMQMHLHDPVPRLPSDLSRYQTVLNKLMAKQADQRYESANALLTDLNALPVELTAPSHHNQHKPANASKGTAGFGETNNSTVLGASFVIMVSLAAALLFLGSQTESALPDEQLRCPLLTPAQTQERNQLLELASVHEDIGRLTHPPGANALQAYRLALEIDPCNQNILDAVAGVRSTAIINPHE